MADSGSERAHNKVWAANLEERLLATSRLYREDVSVTSEHRTIAPGPIYCTIQRDYPPMWCAAHGGRRSGAPRLAHRIVSLRRTSRMSEIRFSSARFSAARLRCCGAGMPCVPRRRAKRSKNTGMASMRYTFHEHGQFSQPLLCRFSTCSLCYNVCRKVCGHTVKVWCV